MASNVLSSTEVEELILRQRQASRVGQTIPLMPEGGTLKGAVLQGFDLRDAKFQSAELRGPNYGSRNSLDPEHWGRGPAVAIAAAEKLATHQDIQNGNP